MTGNNIRADLATLIGKAITYHYEKASGTHETTVHHRALEIGMWCNSVTSLRPHRVDSAELIGFIRDTDPDGTMGAAALADAIVDRFNLDQEA